MNVNKLFKIVAGLFICTALLALIFAAIALITDSKSDSENDPGKRAEVVEKQEKDAGDVQDEALGGDTKVSDKASEKPDASKEKNDSTQGKTGGMTDGTDIASEGQDAGTVPTDDTDVTETTPAGTGTTETEGTPAEIPTKTAEGLPIGQSVPKENLKFDGSETHFVLQNINYQVNVRKEASKTSDKVGELLKGAYGIVLEKGEEFSLVQCGDLTGYILNTYLMTGRGADEQIQGTSSRKVRIDRAVFIRDDANMESNKLATASVGAEYSFDPTAPEVHGWVAIVYEDAPKAYVSAAFCTVE